MNVQLFGKIGLPCIANWTLLKTTKDNEDQISFCSSYLDWFPTTQKAINAMQV